jgi:hypothetical protein
MGKLFGSTEALNVVMALTGQQGDDFNMMLDDMNTKTGQVDKAFNTIVKNDPSFQFAKLKAELNDIGVSLGSVVVPSILDMIQALKDLGVTQGNVEGTFSGLGNAFYVFAQQASIAMASITGDDKYLKNAELAFAKTYEGIQKAQEEHNKKILETRIAFDKEQKKLDAQKGTESIINSSIGMPKPFSMIPEKSFSMVPSKDEQAKLNALKGEGMKTSNLYGDVAVNKKTSFSMVPEKPFNMTSPANLGMQESMNTANQWADLLAQAEPYLSKAKVVNDDITDGMADQLELQKEKNREEAGFVLTKAGRLAMSTPGVDNSGIKGVEAWTPDKVNEEIGLLKQLVKGQTMAGALT